jgi:hypothetical protein
VAFDISLGESSPEALLPQTFEDFYAASAEQVASVLSLACNDLALADASLAAALTRASQRWSYLKTHPNQIGWVIHEGLRHADKALRDGPALSVNQATGGYVRGLDLPDALAALPLQQRAAVISRYYLGWSDEFTAAGFETTVATQRTRRDRGASFLAHHLRLPESDVEPLLKDHLQEQGLQHQVLTPELPMVRRRGRQLTARNRVAAFLLVAAVIVAGGALFRTATQQTAAVAAPEPVAGPSTSPNWFDPISDGRGGFVALNSSGASRFVRSSDGLEWFESATWNSRAVDLRTEVTGFLRTGDRYLAVLETVSAVNDFLAPHIATSTDLREWVVRQIDVDEPPPIDGLRRDYNVVGAAASGEHVLVALQTTEELDHRSFGIRPDQICAESSTPTDSQYFLCDGETVLAVGLNGESTGETTYFLASGGDRFSQVELPRNTAPRRLVGFGGGFAVVDENQGQVWVSPNGTDWERATTSARPNRFVLLEGAGSGTLVIEPDEGGWRSHVVTPSGLGASGDIALDIAPAGIWSQPDVASGPAGWALFVTTSRPWERVGDTPGWAVAGPEWIVSQLPDADTITAQSIADGTTLRLAAEGPWVHVNDNGNVELRNPDDNTTLIEVTQQEIADARPAALDDASVKAQVFFSPDGVAWTSVWSSTEDAWSGSIAVGDDELVLSGTQLTGGPITIPLEDE